MPTTVHRPLKVIAFNANGIGRQSFEVRKQLQELKIDVPLFSETHLKPYMTFYIPNYDFIRLTVKTGTKAELSLQLRKESLTHA
jgi:inorganic pyrophosphatase